MKGFKVAVFHMKFCILLLEKIKEEWHPVDAHSSFIQDCLKRRCRWLASEWEVDTNVNIGSA